MRTGETLPSIFNLIAATLGAGTITLPYIAAENGIVLAIVLVVFGAFISYYSGMLLVKCAEKVGSSKYEDFAQHAWGRKMALFTGWCNVITLLGFTVSYIVFVKTLIPQILCTIFDEDNLPAALGKDQWKGQIVWATIYTVLVLTPLSLPRKAGTLTYASLLGFIATIYLVLCIVVLFFADRSLTPDMAKNITEARYFRVSYGGMASSIPFVVFAFMYQPNIPMIYRELNTQTYSSMKKVVIGATATVVVVYWIASTFGYLGLVNSGQLQILIETSNILEVEYKNWAFTVAIILLLFTVFSAAPLVVLPAKDAFEEILFKEKGMSKRVNIVVTIVMCLGCYVFAVTVPTISDVIQILGSTTNPLIGFILPILFHFRLTRNEVIRNFRYWAERVICWLILLFIVAVSGASLVLFIIAKAQ